MSGSGLDRLDRIQIFSYQEWTRTEIFSSPLISEKFDVTFVKTNENFVLLYGCCNFSRVAN